MKKPLRGCNNQLSFLCYLPHDLYLVLRKEAFDQKKSMSSIIRDALRDKLFKN